MKELNFVFRFYGVKSLKVALSYHLCARIQSCRGDFRSALTSEREAYQIYKLQVIYRLVSMLLYPILIFSLAMNMNEHGKVLKF